MTLETILSQFIKTGHNTVDEIENLFLGKQLFGAETGSGELKERWS